MEHRPISAIARDIRRAWPNVNYAARPYLDAMRHLNRPLDNFGFDDARDIVLRFLGNASSFRGEQAKALKAELRTMVK
jgi:hypothetical protein